MAWDNSGKNLMLDAISAVAVRVGLHSGDPGTAADNETTAPRETVVWAAAVGGDAALNADVLFEGGAPNGDVLWFTVWDATDTTRYGKGQITTGEVTFNASGEFTLTTAARLRITDS